MSECNCSMRQQLVGDGCHICNPELAKDLSESDLVEDLLHFFEMREGEHISDVDIEGMMDKAALRIEELESRELGYIQSLRELEARVREFSAGITAVWDLIDGSKGVYGLHLNGDPAPWDSLLSGGMYEDWLKDLPPPKAE